MASWFLNPWALLIAGAVLPTLLILYFLKLRRREEVVPSTLLWKRAVQDLQVNAPFQKLRKNLLLLLQMLILSAGVIALARPIVTGTENYEGRVVILLDRSASMNTLEPDGRTRLTHAKDQAQRRARTFNRRGSAWTDILSFAGAAPKTQLMVVAFANQASVLQPFTTNVNEVLAAIDAVQPSDSPSDISEALQLAEAYMAPPARVTDAMSDTPVRADSPGTLLLFSDGVLPAPQGLAVKSQTAEWIKIGEVTDNVGITAFRTRRDYENPELMLAFVEIRNFGYEPARTDVSIFLDGQLIDAKSVSLEGVPRPAEGAASAPAQAAQVAPGSTTSLTFERPVLTAGRIEVRLSRKDALATDNIAYGVVPAPRKLRVLLVSAKNWALETVLRGLPLEALETVSPPNYEAAPPTQFEQDGRSRYDVVIFDKHVTKRLPMGNYLALGAVPEGIGITVTGSSRDYRLIWWDETHPVMRYVNLDYVAVRQGLMLQAPLDAEKLCEANVGPAFVHHVSDGRHFLVLGFAVEESDFPKKVGFPVFMYNAIRYLGSGGEVESDEVMRPGATLRLQLPVTAEQAQISTPDGRIEAVRADSAGVARFAATDKIGVYEARTTDQVFSRHALNLEDANESDIKPRKPTFGAGSVEVSEGAQIKQATPEIWRWFVGVAFVVAMLEWWLYNRRVAV